MSTPESRCRWLALVLLLLPSRPPLAAEPAGPTLGQRLDAAALEALPATVWPDGRGLPAGRGSVARGRELYAAKCASCHGPKGQGGTADELRRGRMPLTSASPDKTIGRYWPYATTVFDFIRRAMPMDAPGSLEAGEAYALTAYVLYLNDLLAEDAVLDAASLAALRMPNRDGFIRVHPE